MRSVKSTTRYVSFNPPDLTHPQFFHTSFCLFLSARSHSHSAAGRAKSIMNVSDDDDNAVSMKSVARYLSLFTLFIISLSELTPSSINHPHPHTVSKSKSKSVKGMSHDHLYVIVYICLH